MIQNLKKSLRDRSMNQQKKIDLIHKHFPTYFHSKKIFLQVKTSIENKVWWNQVFDEFIIKRITNIEALVKDKIKEMKQ